MDANTATSPEPEALLDPVAIRLRDLLDVENGEAVNPGAGTRGDLAVVAEFYIQREWAPLWSVDGQLSEAARAVIGRLQQAAEDGLDPTAYLLPNPKVIDGAALSSDLLAEAEIKLSRSIIAYARHATSGRVRPSKISGHI